MQLVQKDAFQHLEEAIRSWSTEVADACDGMTQRLDDTQQELAAAEHRTPIAESSIVDLRTELEALRQSVAEAAESYTAFDSRVATIEDRLGRVQEDMAELGSFSLPDNLVRTPDLVALREELAESESFSLPDNLVRTPDLEALQEQLSALQETAQSLPEDAATKSELDALRAELEALRNAPTPSPEETASADDIQALRDEIEAVRSTSLELPEDIVLSPDLEGLHAQFDAIREEIDTLRQEAAPAVDLDTLRNELEAIRALAGKQPEGVALDSDLETVRRDLLELRERASTLTDQVAVSVDLKSVEGRLDALESGLESLPKEVADFNSVQGLRKEMAAMRAEHAARMSTLPGHRDLDSLRTQVRTLREKLQASDAASPLPPAAPELDRAPDRDQPTAPEAAMDTLDHEIGSDAIQPETITDLNVFDDAGHRRLMGEILIEAGTITEDQLQEALAAQSGPQHRPIGQILIDIGAATETEIARTLAAQLQLDFVHLEPFNLDRYVAKLISGRLASRHVCLPIRASDYRILLAMTNPLDLIAIEDVELASGRQVDTVVATLSNLHEAIEYCHFT